MKNIILTGMPGAGKSTVGVVLAKKLGYGFTDCDLVIQETCGKLLHQLIEEKGEAGFLALENRINASLQRDRSVIATGGSAVDAITQIKKRGGKEAMEHLGRIGKVIYLRLPCEEIERRLGDLHERGVVLREGATLYELYRERVPLYEKYASITIDCDGKSIREIVEEISERCGGGEETEDGRN